jgi:hypothetical protein
MEAYRPMCLYPRNEAEARGVKCVPVLNERLLDWHREYIRHDVLDSAPMANRQICLLRRGQGITRCDPCIDSEVSQIVIPEKAAGMVSQIVIPTKAVVGYRKL